MNEADLEPRARFQSSSGCQGLVFAEGIGVDPAAALEVMKGKQTIDGD